MPPTAYRTGRALAGVPLRTNQTGQRESDENLLLHTILSTNVTLSRANRNTQRVTVSQGIADVGLHKDLERYGLRIGNASRDPGMFVAGAIVARQLLKATRWADIDVNSILARIPKAHRDKQRVAGTSSNGVWVPLSALGLQETAQG